MQFLTNIERPKMWNGYQFLLSAAIGDIEDNIIMVVNGYTDGVLADSQESAGASYINSVVHFSIPSIYGSLEGIDYVEVYLKTDLDEVLTDTLTIDVEEPCENPVYILGRNSLGGCVQWMFDTNQGMIYDFGNSIKNKRKTLFAEDLTLNQWNGLHDFFIPTEVYKNNIVELTSSVIKSHSRNGQQLYEVDDAGAKLGVIAINTRNGTETRQVKHVFEMEIEYPEIF